MGSSQSNAHCATSNFQGAALWPGLKSGELAGFGKSLFIIFGFFARFPFLQKLNNKTIPFSSCSSNPPPRCEVFAQILKKTRTTWITLPLHTITITTKIAITQTNKTTLPHSSHPECHELMHAMNWTDGLPITTSVVKILKNVTQESVNLKS